MFFCNPIQLEFTAMSTNKYSVSLGQKKCFVAKHDIAIKKFNQ